MRRDLEKRREKEKRRKGKQAEHKYTAKPGSGKIGAVWLVGTLSGVRVETRDQGCGRSDDELEEEDREEEDQEEAGPEEEDPEGDESGEEQEESESEEVESEAVAAEIHKRDQIKDRLRNLGKNQGKKSDSKNIQAPLIATRNGGTKYKPYQLGDVKALADLLPPITEGGAASLRKFDELTKGTELAIGDFRAVGARCFPRPGLKEIEETVGTIDKWDETPLAMYITELSQALRERYPTPNCGKVPKFEWKPEQPPRQYIEDAKEEWARTTGSHPGKGGAQQEWFRRAVLEGVPEKVKDKMMENPDLAGAESHLWERHLVHHLQLEKDKEGKKSKDKEQLLKMQLGEARQRANDKKKEKQSTARVMVSQEQPRGPDSWPELDPNIYPSDPWGCDRPDHSHNYWGPGALWE